jgi:hypothetical protein
MGITSNSRSALRIELDRLQGQKDITVKKIKDLGDKRDALIVRRDVLTDSINKIKQDIESI